MDSSIFCNYAIFVHLLIIQLIITVSSFVRLLTIRLVSTASIRVRLLVIQSTLTTFYSLRPTMPAITRSKAKALLSLNQSLSPVGSSGISSQFLSPIKVHNQSKSYYDALMNLPDRHGSSSSIDNSEFQNLENFGVQFENSELSPFENLEPLVIDTNDATHNFSNLTSSDMEGDCKDDSLPPAIKNDADSNITQLFTLLSQQITQLSNQNILRENENVMVTRLQTVVQDNEAFQQSVRSEMDDLRRL
jgi:hypothetical protein